MLTKSEIEYLQKNKYNIDKETLSKIINNLRDKGFKKEALEILDLERDSNMCYLDAFDKPISFNSDKSLKKERTVLKLHDFHIEEIEKCSKDFFHFRNNYITIKTKQGIDFPEFRSYQEKFIGEILNDENEQIVGLMGRQCIDGNTEVKIVKNGQEATTTIKQLFEKF